jgi:hypothetical protein
MPSPCVYHVLHTLYEEENGDRRTLYSALQQRWFPRASSQSDEVTWLQPAPGAQHIEKEFHMRHV